MRRPLALDHRLPRAAEEPAPSEPVGPDPVGINYYRTLAFHLRLRQLPETRVAQILQEVRELSLASGSAPEAEFGPAQEYAEQFGRRQRRCTASLVVFSACLLACLAIQVLNMSAGLRGGDRLLPPGPTLLICAVLLVGGATFAVLYEHRLPRAFRAAA